MIDPTTAEPVSSPLTADVRSGYRSPPITMIIGKTGPVATPARANSAIDAGSDGTRIAADERHGHRGRRRCREQDVVEAVGESGRQEPTEGDPRPVERQGGRRGRQRRRLEEPDQPVRHADLGRDVAADRDGQQDERQGEAIAGPLHRAALVGRVTVHRRVRRPCGIGTVRNSAATTSAARPVPSRIVCHGDAALDQPAHRERRA